VLTVCTFKGEQQALQLANDSRYGLAAAVFTEDKARLARVSNSLRVGIVWNRCSQPCFPQLPWGGPKLSGNMTVRGCSFLQPNRVQLLFVYKFGGGLGCLAG